MRYPFLLTVAAAAVAATLSLACGQEEDVAQPAITGTAVPTTTPAASPSSLAPTSAPAITPGPGVTLYRWVNVTVLIPNGSAIRAGPNFAGARQGQTVGFSIIEVDPDDSRIVSEVLLDAETGAVVEEMILDQHRPDLSRVLATVYTTAFDRAVAPWPYNGEPTPDLVRGNEGGISWIRPSPSTGLYVGWGLADPGGFFVDLRNERSAAFAGADPVTGKFNRDTSAVHPDDLPVFERWLATVKQCGTEIEC